MDAAKYIFPQNFPPPPPWVVPDDEVCVLLPPELLSGSGFAVLETEEYRNISLLDATLRLPSRTWLSALNFGRTLLSCPFIPATVIPEIIIPRPNAMMNHNGDSGISESSVFSYSESTRASII